MADQKTQLPSKELHHQGGGPPKPRSLLPPILCKSFFFLLFLVTIPLFPSQAPNFIGQSVFTKLWELVHLLFIGLAVSYGLFCRRNGELDTEQVPSFEDSQSSLVSRIFHVCPIFEDGYENPSGSDGKIGYQGWSSGGYYQKEGNFENGGSVGNEKEESKERSLDSEGAEFDITFEKNEVWNSQHFQGEPVVVMSEPSDNIGGYGEFASVVGYKPLGLPVRSLNSGVLNPGSPQFSDGGLSSSSFRESSSGGSEMNGDGKDFGDVGPRNLKLKFDETVASWHSRSGLGSKEEAGSGGTVRSQSRPLLEEAHFESLRSHSFQSTTSQASSASRSPTRVSTSSSISSGTNSEAEEQGKSKTYRASYPPQSQSPFKTINGEAPLNAFHLRRYSSGSLFQKDSQGSSRAKLKDSRDSRKEASLNITERERGSDARLDDQGPVTPSRGKSVRTVRSSRYTVEASNAGNAMKNKANLEGKSTNDEANKATKLKNETQKRNLNPRYHMPKPAYEEYQKEEIAELYEEESEEREEESLPATPPAIAAFTETPRDAGYESSEVDRKAGEFIAKFREQIRRQKDASIDRSRGLQINSNRFR